MENKWASYLELFLSKALNGMLPFYVVKKWLHELGQHIRRVEASKIDPNTASMPRNAIIKSCFLEVAVQSIHFCPVLQVFCWSLYVFCSNAFFVGKFSFTWVSIKCFVLTSDLVCRVCTKTVYVFAEKNVQKDFC